MTLTLSMRQEIHDDACIRCLEPKPMAGECYSCGLEDARIGASGSLESAARNIDAAETARNKRREENS